MCEKCRYKLVDIDIVGVIREVLVGQKWLYAWQIEVSTGKVFECLANKKDPEAKLLGMRSPWGGSS